MQYYNGKSVVQSFYILVASLSPFKQCSVQVISVLTQSWRIREAASQQCRHRGCLRQVAVNGVQTSQSVCLVLLLLFNPELVD